MSIATQFEQRGSFSPPVDKPRGINWAIQRGKPQNPKKQATNYKLVPECSPIKEFGDKFSRG